MTIRDFLSRFEHKTPTGDQWLVRCPGHDDRKASLAVREGLEGRIVLNCHAGCTTDGVLQVMGLTLADLFAVERTGRRREVATYDYTDEQGKFLYQVVRTEPKGFFQRRPNGRGGWDKSLGDVRRVLYRLGDLRGPTCFICEGEKDVQALLKLGICATTNAGGAGKWRPEYTQQLRAAGVNNAIVIPDNDDAGRQHAHNVASSCHAAGLNVKVIALPGVGPKGDLSDYIAAGHAQADVLALAKNVALYKPKDQPAGAPTGTQLGPVVKCVADVQSEKVSWLWRRRLARGKLTLLMGDPGVGKSFITIDVTSRITRGGAWPDGGYVDQPGNVLFLAVEDGIGDTIRPRLERAGADLSRVFVLTTIRDEAGDRLPNFEQDMKQLEDVIVEHKPMLVVVDPISSYLGKSDSYKDTEMRRVLAPLAVLADKHKVAIVALVHMTKGSKDGKALYRAMGSIAFAALARIVLAAGSDPEVSTRCYLMPVKQNICQPAATLAYGLTSDPDDEDGPAVLAWEGAPVDGVRADAILGGGISSGEREQQRDASEFLQQLLSDGRMSAEDVWAAVGKNKYSASTISRAKARAGVKTVKEGFKDGRWYWELEAKAPKALTYAEMTFFGEKQSVSTIESTAYSKNVTTSPMTSFVTTFGAEDNDPEAGLV